MTWLVFEFKFPDVGEGIHEGEIVNWLVGEGDHVDEDEDIVEVMTDKATVQISAPVAGTIQTIVFDEGETVTVGETFVLISPDEAIAPDEDEDEPASSKPSTEEPARKPEPSTQPVEQTSNGEGVIRTRTPKGVLAPPRVRIEARKRGIDIATVEGSGPAGRVLMEDLETGATTGGPKARDASSEAVDGFTFDVPSVDREDALRVEPMAAPAGSTRAVAHRSTTLQPHFTLAVRIAADDLQEALDRDAGPEEGVIEPVAAVVKALAQGLLDHPRMNALVDEDEDELVHMEDVNVAVVWPSEDGAVLCTVPRAGQKGLREIQATLEAGGEEDAVPTVTVAVFDDEDAYVSTPVLMHPQVTGLVVGSMDEAVVLDEGQARVGHQMTLSFSFDHRWVDGYDGALLAEDVKALLSKPETMLLG